MSLVIVRTVEALRAQVGAWHEAGKTVGVVPTMGALHAGHMTLVDTARAKCDRVIVTLFVNPKQFNNPDDLKAYPRTEAEDAARLEHGGVDLLYAPDGAGMYPEGFSTNISVAGVSEGLCGAFRPGHFDGVATVVTKLLLQTQADRAYFGEKDFQQLAVIKRLVADLDIPVHIIGVPTVREADGLALSSRNVRLSPKGRAIAPALAKALAVAAASIKGGARVEPVVNVAIESLVKAGFESVEYFELRDAQTLAPVDDATRPARLLAAAWLDGVRLIDNLAVQPDS